MKDPGREEAESMADVQPIKQAIVYLRGEANG
jgi:hypothetical protein